MYVLNTKQCKLWDPLQLLPGNKAANINVNLLPRLNKSVNISTSSIDFTTCPQTAFPLPHL